jgi:hypothetical protein
VVVAPAVAAAGDDYDAVEAVMVVSDFLLHPPL